MGDIEKVNGALVGGISINSAESTKNVTWVSHKDWIWDEINELPDSIIEDFHRNYLFPNSVHLSYLKNPSRASVNGIPATTEIVGWLVGDTCLTTFTLTKRIGEVDDQYKLKGSRLDFKEPANKLTLTFKADSPSEIKAREDELRKNNMTNPFGEGKYLPQEVQRLLAGVPNPLYLESCITQMSSPEEKGSISQTVNLVIYNNVVGITLRAQRNFVGKIGMTEKALLEQLEKCDWSTEIVRGFFK